MALIFIVRRIKIIFLCKFAPRYLTYKPLKEISMMNIAVMQLDLKWEEPLMNRHKVENLLTSLPNETDLILLPEFFTTGFSVKNIGLAEPMNGPTVSWMQKIAKEMNCILAGTIPIIDHGKYYNRALYVSREGVMASYNKRHLFSLGSEHQLYTPGNKNVIVEYKNAKIQPQICYDLRFPVWSRNRYSNFQFAYDILIYHANWPDPRGCVWEQLLIARAIENQAYLVGINRCGQDGEGLSYSAPPMILNPKGNIIAQMEPAKEGVLSANIDLGELKRFREKFFIAPDWDNFDVSP